MIAVSRPLPSILTRRTTRNTDLAVAFLIIVLTVAVSWSLIYGGTMVGQDTSTQFYPWFTHLGQELRSGHIPGWSPFQFSGAPFAADPQSGWMYLLAMLTFTFLPLSLAAKGYVLLHLLIAGLGAYTLARALRMSTLGALTSATAYEYTGFLYARSPCCPNHTGIAAWLPLTLLGAELAIRADRWATRALWWGVTGLAISQSLAIWLGQGSYYVLLALGGYVAYRTLLAPPDSVQDVRGRFGALLLHGGAVLAFGLGLAAAGLFPRLEYNAFSNLAGGYLGVARHASGGWTLREMTQLVRSGTWYAGGATLVLAAVAPLAARRRYAVPYLATLSLAAVILSMPRPTPLHRVMYLLLPGFERLHPHEPERIVVVLYLGAALMAGATITSLQYARDRNALLALPPFLIPLLLLPIKVSIPVVTLNAALAASVLLVLHMFSRLRPQLTSALLLLLVFADLLVIGHGLVGARMQISGAHAFRKVDLGDYYDPTGAGKFLLSRSKEGHFRFFGYDPEVSGRLKAYPPRWTRRMAARLLVNNRATVLGLEDVQGYNPVHVTRYDRYIAALNGGPQEYRAANVYAEGLKSPLLNLLNVRYIVAPAVAPPDRVDLRRRISAYPIVWKDQWVRVRENRSALTRAWIVHSARQMAPDQALSLLSRGKVDPRHMALIEQPPPGLDRPTSAYTDEARIDSYEPDRIQVRTSTAGRGLLMLSEVYYPAWKAYVDGKPARVYTADYLLRAVPVPSGRHNVELRYESTALRVGLFVSILSYLALGVLGVAVGLRRLRLTVKTEP